MELERDPRRLGVVVAGSLSKGLEARLDAEVSVEDMAVGPCPTAPVVGRPSPAQLYVHHPTAVAAG